MLHNDIFLTFYKMDLQFAGKKNIMTEMFTESKQELYIASIQERR